MPDDLAFLRAIGADPDDDGPRLVYADWLEEKGDPAGLARAKFIRVQCVLAAAPAGDGHVGALRQQEHDLLREHWKAWVRPACRALGEPLPDGPVRRTPGSRPPDRYQLRWLPDRDRHDHVIEQDQAGGLPYLHSTQFRRGFLAHAALVHKPSRGERHVARLWDKVPLDGLTLMMYDSTAIAITLAAIDRGERLRSLELGFTDDDSVTFVAGNPHLGSLRELVLRNVVGRADVAEAVGRSTTLRALRTLILDRCPADRAGILTLARSPLAPGLERLGLFGCGLTNDAANVLATEFPPHGRLRRLDLTHDRIGRSGWRVLQERFGDVVTLRTEGPHWPARFYL